ncbi:nucleotidyltransferase domain-containing protein (plasmid) [Legionella pneumophila]
MENNSDVKQQLKECLEVLTKILGADLLGVYLYGSYLVGGLQKYSDIDLFVVTNRTTTSKEKMELTNHLLQISGIYMKSTKPPIEMTLVEREAINPWHYPPLFFNTVNGFVHHLKWVVLNHGLVVKCPILR